MSRVVYLVRHEESNGTRYNRHKYGPKGAGLSPAGVARSATIGHALQSLGIDTSATVASSTKQRAFDTAIHAGFGVIKEYPVLDEVNTELDPAALKTMIARKQLPVEATKAAAALLDAPPSETVWFTHGQLIRAVGNVLGAPYGEQFIPPFGSITTYTICS